MHTSPEEPTILTRLLVVEGASWFATYATPVVLAFTVLGRGGGSGEVGVVLAADTLGMLASVSYGGAVADRLQRHRVMWAAELAAAALQALAALLLVGGELAVTGLAVLQGLVGLSRGFFNPAATGLVASLIQDDRKRQRANGFLGAAQAGAPLPAPPLAGVVVAASGPAAALFANVGAYALSAVVLRSLPSTGSGGRTAPVLEAIRQGWRELRAREWLWLTVLWFSALQCFAQAPLLVLGPEIAQHSLSGSSGWGIILGGLGGGAAVGAALAGAVRLRQPLRPAVAAYALYALPLLALAKPLPLPVLVAAAIVAGASGGFFGATWFSVFQRNVPREAVSRVSAWDWQASLAGLPIGLLVTPPISRLAGVPLTLAVAAAVTVALTLFVASRASVATVAVSGGLTSRFGACAGATSRRPHRSSPPSVKGCSGSSHLSTSRPCEPTARRASIP